MNKIISFFSLFLVFAAQAQVDTAKVNFLFVGDVMQHGGQIAGAYNAAKDAYDYRDCFQFIKPIVQQADISIANLEVTHAGKPYKGYPQFSAPPELSEALVDAGFNVIITANNHSCDGGGKGVVKTLDVLDRLGVQHTGTFRNKAERDKNYPLIIEEDGMKVAILNYTYGTNGLSVAPPLIINYIDSATMKADFKKAKTLGADLIVCTLHWGTEYQSLPNTYQKHWEKYCYELGADMVIGSHPHVIQPVEVKTVHNEQKVTAWSLGNFVSNQRDRYKNGGLILEVEAQKVGETTRIAEVHHRFAYVYPRQEAVVKPYYILPEYNYSASRLDFMSGEIYQQYTTFFEDSRALFAEHSKGTSELLISDSLTSNHYQKLLKGYYAMEFPKEVLDQRDLFQPLYRNTIHKVLGADGNYHWVLGYFETEEQLRTTIVSEAMIAQPTLVFISPTAYTVLP